MVWRATLVSVVAGVRRDRSVRLIFVGQVSLLVCDRLGVVSVARYSQPVRPIAVALGPVINLTVSRRECVRAVIRSSDSPGGGSH